MRLNDGGFLAMLDAMIFIMVIIVAAGLGIGFMDQQDGDDRDVSAFVEDLMSTGFTMSDFIGEDDSPLTMADAIALWLSNGDNGQTAYLGKVLDSFSRGRPYLMDVRYEPLEGGPISDSIGTDGSVPTSWYEMTVPTTTGGTVTVSLYLFGS